MDFLIKLLGLDTKAQGILIGYRTYLVLLIAVLVNLGPALQDAAAICGVLVAILTLVVQFADTAVGWHDAWVGISAQAALLRPHVAHLSLCLGAIAAAYWKSSQDRKHAEVVEKLTLGPAPVQIETPAANDPAMPGMKS